MDWTIVPRAIQAETVNKLREAILAGYFKPGERLVEANLCEMMDVSRTSVREALRRLEGEKLVVIVHNKGPSVAEITWEQAEEIYDVRLLLEAEAAALFAERATAADIRKMRAALQAFRQAVMADDAIGRLAATNAFYDVILEGCGNRVIQEILQGLLARINLLRSRSMSRPGRSRFSAAELRRLLRAIEAGDAAATRKAAVDHVRAAREAARSAFAPVDAAVNRARAPAAPQRAGARLPRASRG